MTEFLLLCIRYVIVLISHGLQVHMEENIQIFTSWVMASWGLLHITLKTEAVFASEVLESTSYATLTQKIVL